MLTPSMGRAGAGLLRAFFLLIFFSVQPVAAVAFTGQFKDWFPQYDYIWKSIMRDNCSEEYDTYVSAVIDLDKVDWRGGGGLNTGIAQPVVQCLLDNSSEYVKAVMTGAQVILGVTPTVLSLLSASSEEFAMLAVVGRRPLLAMLLGLGSPSVYLSRAYAAWDPAKLLKRRKYSYRQQVPRTWLRSVMWVLQYLLAMASIANIGTLTWQLGMRAIVAMWANHPLGPMVWTLFVMPVHLVGTFCMWLRIQRLSGSEVEGIVSISAKETPRGFRARMWSPGWISRLWRTETTLSVAQPKLDVKIYDESLPFILLSWLVSTAIVTHIILGTVILSNILFVGPKDALEITGRYMASVVLCRVVLMYELAGIRTAYSKNAGSDDDSEIVAQAAIAEIPKAQQPMTPLSDLQSPSQLIHRENYRFTF